MRIKVFALNAALALAPLPLAAEGGPDPASVARLVTEIEKAGCELRAETAADILAKAEISEENAAIALDRLKDEGRAKLLPEGIWRLIGAVCPS